MIPSFLLVFRTSGQLEAEISNDGEFAHLYHVYGATGASLDFTLSGPGVSRSGFQVREDSQGKPRGKLKYEQ